MAKFIINATITIDGTTINNEVDAVYQTKVIMARYKMLSIPSDAEINIVAKETHQHFPCPFCGADNTIYDGGGEYHCKDCRTIFREDDVIAEPIRHHLSAILSADGAMNDDNGEISLPCEITIGNGEVVTAIHETRDGIIYFDLKGHEHPEEFDLIAVEDLRIILNTIS